MSVRIVKKKVYECVCELPDCPGNGESWLSRNLDIPKRCNHCHSYRWNGTDKRIPDNPQPDDIREYNRQAQAKFRARQREERLKKGKRGQRQK